MHAPIEPSSLDALDALSLHTARTAQAARSAQVARSSPATPPAPFALPPQLWPRFLAEHSLRVPAALRAPLTQPLLSPDELFALLVAAADSIRRGVPRELRIYLGDRKMVARQTSEQLGAAYPALLPRRADATLAGYGERLRTRHGYPCFAIMLNNCQVLSPTLWARVRDFAAGLVAEVGFPLGGIDANLFAGNYRRTPFGVHTDELDVFTWIVEGTKRFLVWPAAQLDPLFGPAAAAPRHPHDYADQRSRGQRLAGRAGDLLYWPRAYWHVAEAGPEQLTSTLSIGLDPQLPARAWAGELLGNLATQLASAAATLSASSQAVAAPPAPAKRRRAGAAAPPSSSSSSSSSSSASLAAAVSAELPAELARLAAAVADGELTQRFERELRLRWMSWTTSLGLRTPPRARPRPLRVKDRVRGDTRWPLSWQLWKGQLLCAANGYSFAVPAWPGIDKILMRLQSGEVIRIRDLYSSLSRKAELPRLRSFLLLLLSLRAISLVEDRVSGR